MAIQAEPNKRGILSLIAIIILMVLVTALSNPIYKACPGKAAKLRIRLRIKATAAR